MKSRLSKRDRRWLSGQVTELINAVTDERYDTAGQLLGEVGQRLDHFGVYVLCVAMCEVVHEEVCPGMPIGDGSLLDGPISAVEVQAAPGVSDEVAQAAAENSPHLWAGRFVAAYFNGDRDTTLALFMSSLHDRDRAVENVRALIMLATAVVSGKTKVRYVDGPR